MTTDNFNDVVIKATNLGEDTDTVGACVGALAGKCYGEKSINDEWKKSLISLDKIVKMCVKIEKYFLI